MSRIPADRIIPFVKRFLDTVPERREGCGGAREVASSSVVGLCLAPDLRLSPFATLAYLADVDPETIRRIVNGRAKHVGFAVADKIISAIDVSLWWGPLADLYYDAALNKERQWEYKNLDPEQLVTPKHSRGKKRKYARMAA